LGGVKSSTRKAQAVSQSTASRYGHEAVAAIVRRKRVVYK
jgi:hypothetical protein